MPCIGNPAYSFRPILLKLYRYFAAFLWFHMRNLSLAGYNCSGGASCMACSFIMLWHTLYQHSEIEFLLCLQRICAYSAHMQVFFRTRNDKKCQWSGLEWTLPLRIIWDFHEVDKFEVPIESWDLPTSGKFGWEDGNIKILPLCQIIIQTQLNPRLILYL